MAPCDGKWDTSRIADSSICWNLKLTCLHGLEHGVSDTVTSTCPADELGVVKERIVRNLSDKADTAKSARPSLTPANCTSISLTAPEKLNELISTLTNCPPELLPLVGTTFFTATTTSLQALAADAATSSLYFPCSQYIHAVLPGDSAKLPGRQKTQVWAYIAPSLVEYLPLAHCTQSDALAFPRADKYVPATHFVHPVLPLTSEKVPAPQGMQAESEVAPALLENLPAVHLTHAPALVAANSVE